jgi:hypothetical protein
MSNLIRFAERSLLINLLLIREQKRKKELLDHDVIACRFFFSFYVSVHTAVEELQVAQHISWSCANHNSDYVLIG